MSKDIDKLNRDRLYEKLTTLDLSEKEARVYIDLLGRSQPVGTSKIISTTKLHGQNVYDALFSLEAKGLTKHAIVRGRKKFSANSPTRLAMLIEVKKKVAEDVAKELLAMVNKEHQQDFEIFQGDHAFISREFDVLAKAKDNEQWFIIGGSGDRFFETLGANIFEEYESERSGKKISIQYIGSEDQQKELGEIKLKRKSFDFRVMPKFGKSIVNTVIRPGNITLTTFGIPLLSYEVKNEEVVESYRNFFESLWALST